MFRQKPITPPPGTPLRKAILDALRPVIEKDLKQRVLFRVTTLRVLGEWAFTHVEPRRPNDTPIDFKKTHYAQLIKDGVFDGPSCFALLRRKRGRWVPLVFVIGPTDVAWSAWVDPPYNAPKAVLGLP